MKVVFLGSPPTAVPTLEALVAAGVSIPLVVTQPDRPAGRSKAPRPTAVKEAASRHGLDVLDPPSAKAAGLLEALSSAAPDVLVVVAYGNLLPRSVLDVAPLGAVNVHFSLLPAYRGAAPVQWALAGGEEATGVTTMQIALRLDEGDVLLQREVKVLPREHAPSLLVRLADAGAELLLETLARLRAGDLPGKPQDGALATYAPMLRPADGEVRFDMTARQMEGRVRGFDPWPGVWAWHKGRRLRFVEARATNAPTAAAPGSILAFADGAFHVACGQGTVLAVEAVQLEGRRAITSAEANNGRQLLPGDLLEARPA